MFQYALKLVDFLHMYPRCFSSCCLCAGTGAREVVHVPFKTRVSLSYCLLALRPKHHWFPKPDVMGAHLPRVGSPMCGPDSSFLRESLYGWTPPTPATHGSLGLECGPDETVSLPLLQISGWYCLCILSRVISFLLVLRSFSEIVLVCRPEEVSSGAASSAIWIPPPARFHFLLL